MTCARLAKCSPFKVNIARRSGFLCKLVTWVMLCVCEWRICSPIYTYLYIYIWMALCNMSLLRCSFFALTIPINICLVGYYSDSAWMRAVAYLYGSRMKPKLDTRERRSTFYLGIGLFDIFCVRRDVVEVVEYVMLDWCITYIVYYKWTWRRMYYIMSDIESV